MLNVNLAGLDFIMHPLMAGIKTAYMIDHRHQAGLFLHLHDALGVFQRIRHRYLDQHVFACAHYLLGLSRVYRRRGSQNSRLYARLR